MKPMLAVHCEEFSKITYPVLASPKLDGVRALVIGGELLSRSLKPIPNAYVQSLFSSLPEGTDGELILGDPTTDPYRRTVSAVMSEDGKPEDIRFYVFDNFKVPGSFRSRFVRVKMLDAYPVFAVPHSLVRNAEELETYEAWAVGAGYEGAMIRAIDGPYKFGRSTLKEGYLLKVKRFVDSEAEVIGSYERMHNGNEATRNALGKLERSTRREGLSGRGDLGGFNVRDCATGVEFEIGTGYTDAERADFWTHREALVGQILKYKYFPTGSKEKPRHPVYLGMRDPRDISD